MVSYNISMGTELPKGKSRTTPAPGRGPGITTGQEVEKPMEEHSMTAIEAARLIDWLTANGHSEKEATECIKFIATGIQQTKPQQTGESQ